MVQNQQELKQMNGSKVGDGSRIQFRRRGFTFSKLKFEFCTFLATNFIQEHYCCWYCLQRDQQLREISLPTDGQSSPVFPHAGS